MKIALRLYSIAVGPTSSTAVSNGSLASCTSPLLAFCVDLQMRGLIYKSHPPIKLGEDSPLAKLPPTLYAGFDSTASSLHVGNLLVVTQLIRSSALFKCRPLVLIGGATALVGDPSGKTKERRQMSYEEGEENSRSLIDQLHTLTSNAEQMFPKWKRQTLTVLNNMQWYEKMPALEFLRLGKTARVGDMLRLGPIRARMEQGGMGLSYTEFSYQILQAIDWELLSRERECFFQLGGSDQLGNLEAGYEFIRDRHGAHPACGVCLPLLTDKRGIKLGKSTMEQRLSEEGGDESGKQEGLWLNGRKTSPFAFYQYFRQMHDDQAEEILPYFSLRPLDEVHAKLEEHRRNLGKWVVQRELAEELTRLVHGVEGLETAQRCSRLLFEGSLEEMKSLSAQCIRDLFGPASTFNLGRRSIRTMGELADATRKEGSGGAIGSKQMLIGGFYLNGERRTNPDERLDGNLEPHLLQGRFSLVRWGKRDYALVEWI